MCHGFVHPLDSLGWRHFPVGGTRRQDFDHGKAFIRELRVKSLSYGLFCFQYIKSEKKLLDLKKQLKIQSPFYANIYFIVRSAFRLMPANLLGKIYNTFLRKKVEKTE